MFDAKKMIIEEVRSTLLEDEQLRREIAEILAPDIKEILRL